MRSSLPARCALVATVVALAGCMPTPTAPADGINISGVLSAMNSTMNVASGAIAAGAVPTAFVLPIPTYTGSCPFVAADKDYICAPYRIGGYSVARTVWFYDAAGNNISAPVVTGADGLKSITSMTGTLNFPLVSGVVGVPGSTGTPGTSTATTYSGGMLVTRVDTFTMRGLTGSVATLDGSSSSSSEFSIFGASGTQRTTSTQVTTLRGITFPISPSAFYAPTGGTMISDESIALTSGPPLTLHTVLTFNQDGSAAMTVTYGSTTRNCTLASSLSSRLLVPLLVPTCR